jgi:mannitol-1-phosphate 5-dehydrogenase
MNHTGSRSEVDIRKIIIFGAGKIGRSFIGQLFGSSGYKVVFIDVDPVLIAGLNKRKSYRVVIKGHKDTEIVINNVRAVSASDKEKVTEEVATAGILAVCVGKKALDRVIPAIAAGLEARFSIDPEYPLDIVIAENMRSAGEFIRERLKGCLSRDYPLDDLVGLVETSIGKMVPIMPAAELEKDPLLVYAEPYNTLILDACGFKLPVPDVKGLAPKRNIRAWVDRKAFIHNLGHATAAYFGHFRHPGAVYMFEVLDDDEVYSFTREVMKQSAAALSLAYPGDFTLQDLYEHIDDLLGRFRNKALKDTIFRVGSDLKRKLGPDDRFTGAIRLAVQTGTPLIK